MAKVNQGLVNVIGNNIKRFREENSISRNDLAKAINVTVQAISQYENCKRLPSDTLLTKIATALGVDTSDLLGISNETTQAVGNFIINNKNKITNTIENFKTLDDMYKEYVSNQDSWLHNNNILLMFLLENIGISKDFNIELNAITNLSESIELKSYLKYLLSEYYPKEGE